MSRRRKSTSMITIATIFTDEIESAVARNSAVMIRFSVRGSIESGNSSQKQTAGEWEDNPRER
jgi:hypothetical protein